MTDDQASSKEASPAASWWQRLIPGGSRRLARRGVGKWRQQKLDEATISFAGAAELEPLGIGLRADGLAVLLLVVTYLLAAADQGGVSGAAYNSGTAALVQSQPGPALEWLRRAMLADPDDPRDLFGMLRRAHA